MWIRKATVFALLVAAVAFVPIGATPVASKMAPFIRSGTPAGSSSTQLESSLLTQSSSSGYRLVASDGGIFSFGDAQFYGSTGNIKLNAPIVGMASTPDGKGYWLVASDGGIFSFGDAQFYGSTGAMTLNKPIVGMASTPDGKGYWLVASDGGIFSFGDAQFYGSTGAMTLNKPIVGMASTPDGKGYWLVASDGGIFSFGDAQFYGSTGNIALNAPIVGMAADPSTGGYWLVASDGGIFSFNAPFRGSAGNITLNAPIVGMAVSSLDPYAPGESGIDLSFPQCSAPPQVFTPKEIAVIGVTSAPFTNANTCLSSQFQSAVAAGAVPSLYAVLSSPVTTAGSTTETLTGPEAACAATGSTTCQGFNWGYNAAQSAYSYAASQGVSASTWWLDIEVGTASATSCTNTGLWTCDTAVNDQVLAGAIAFYSSVHVQVGIYSTNLQFSAVAGTYSPGLPIWIAGAPVTTPTSYCTNTAQYFGGGVPWLVQVLAGEYGGPVDLDYAC